MVNDKLSGMADKFNEKMTAARDFVNNGIEKIKNLFNITFPTPKIKMPHVSVTGSFSLDPPSIPKFGIEWYKDGGILNGPTIFGAREAASWEEVKPGLKRFSRCQNCGNR